MGDVPGSWFGDCHDPAVPGDFPGEGSSFKDCPADNWPIFKPRGVCDWLAVTKPLGCGICVELGNREIFLNCGKCFSRAQSMPSFVKGLGKTSFIPVTS